MKINTHHVDAFSSEAFGGNPTVVITEADALSDDMMRRIANEVYLSETTFIMSSAMDDCHFRFRFFAPAKEYNMSGHSFISSCFTLAYEGKVILNEGVTRINIETNSGKVPVNFYFSQSDGERNNEKKGTIPGIPLNGINRGTLEKIMIQQDIGPHRSSDVPVGKIAEILGIDKNEIRDTELPVEIITAGIEVLLLPIKHRETLINMKPDLIKLSLLNKQFNIQANHLFSLETFSEDSTAYTRGFVPTLGLWEDPASGTSSAALGSYLLRHGVTSSSSMIMEQGNESGNLARILVEKNDTIDPTESIMIGGVAALSIVREIVIEENSVSIA